MCVCVCLCVCVFIIIMKLNKILLRYLEFKYFQNTVILPLCRFNLQICIET